MWVENYVHPQYIPNFFSSVEPSLLVWHVVFGIISVKFLNIGISRIRTIGWLLHWLLSHSVGQDQYCVWENSEVDTKFL